MLRSFSFVLPVLFLSPAFSAERVDGIEAIVNDQIVTSSDLESFEKRLGSGEFIDELLAGGHSVEELKNDESKRLQYLINERVIDSLIKKRGLEVTMDQVERETKQMAAKNNLTRAQLVDALKAQGIQISDYQHIMKTRMERQGLIEQEVSSRIQITDEEVLSAYNRDNRGQNSNVYEYTLSHILFLPEQGDSKKALERARKVQAELQQGKKSFEQIAKEHSEDPNFSQGGKLGTFRAGEILPEIEKAVSSVEEGGTTGIIQSQAGFHIVKLNNKKLIPDPAFLQKKEQYRAQLFEQAFKKYFNAWLEQQKEDAFVRIN